MSDIKNTQKPLKRKAYGSIPHLLGSRLGPKDYAIHAGQDRICTQKVRDRHDNIIVTEKLDGSNVAVCKVDNEIIALGRAGYKAITSPYEQHKIFHRFVMDHEHIFSALLDNGDSVHGEWIALAHGTIYEGVETPFYVFDYKVNGARISCKEMWDRCGEAGIPVIPPLHIGGAISSKDAIALLEENSLFKTPDVLEGVVYRVERRGAFDYLAKFVQHQKVDGKYMKDLSVSQTEDDVWNWQRV